MVRNTTETFYSRIHITPNGCYEWQGGLDKKGYGRFTINRVPRRASRVAWQLSYGQVPEGMHVLHTCDNRACVNVNHLYLGTNDDNVRDRVVRNRSNKGIEHPYAKLTESNVLQIRRLHTTGLGYGRLARKFHVSPWTIRNVVKRIAWKHV